MAEQLSSETRASLDAAMGIEPAPAPQGEPAPAPEAAPEPSAGAAPEQEATRPDPEPPTPAPEPENTLAQLPELLRLKKQAEKRAREATDKARQEVEDMKAELESLRAKVQKPLENPVEFFREAGMNPLEVAKMIASAELPADKADPQARLRYEQMKQKTQAQQEIEKLRAELEGFKKEQQSLQQQQQATKILAEIRKADETLLQETLGADSLMAGLYRTNPEYALEQMLEFRRKYADAYPDDPIPAADEVAAHLERQLKSIGYQPPAPVSKETTTQTQAQPAEKQPGQPTPTLSSNELAGRQAKDEIPADEDARIEYLAERLRRGDHL